jgi:uncharacterized membrane protein YfcA
MELELIDAVLLVAGGLFAGFVNTVAGGGSAITLPLLVEVLNDPLLANGTNRVAILLQNSVGVAGFHRGRVVPWASIRRLALPVLGGALVGSWVATQVDPDTMELVFAVVIVGVAMSVLVSPKRWEGGGEARLGPFTETVVFAAIGFYGGFVQAGVGFLLLAGLVLGGGLNLVSGNAAKVALILAFTLIALPVFLFAGQVSLLAGGVLALGNMSGAWIASNLAVSKGGGWIRWVVVIAALAAAARMLLR